MNKTKINYLTHTWNPLVMRCTPISSGCINCWHLRMANRLAGKGTFPTEVQNAYAGKGPPVLVEARLEEPLRLRAPARIGVQLMGDLFHEDVPAEFICQIWLTMTRAQQHTFLILTKRPERMRDWLKVSYGMGKYDPPPLPNVQLGVTVCNADELWKIDVLLQTSAAKRWVSIEPMLSDMNIERYLQSCDECGNQGSAAYILDYDHNLCRACVKGQEGPSLSWVALGAETGPGARPMDEAWARDIIQQCKAANVPVFLKQMGAAWAKQKCIIAHDSKGADMRYWPEDLKIREWPQGHNSP